MTKKEKLPSDQKVQKTYRLSSQTVSQIEDLSTRWGTSLTETVAIMADRAFRGDEHSPVGGAPPDRKISDAKIAELRSILIDGSKPYSQRVMMALKAMDDGLGHTDGS